MKLISDVNAQVLIHPKPLPEQGQLPVDTGGASGPKSMLDASAKST